MATHALTDRAIVLKLEDDVAVARAPLAAGTVPHGRGHVNCGVILEGTPLPVVGRRIFEEIIAVASGRRTKSELSGVGEEEFAPWIIGPVM